MILHYGKEKGTKTTMLLLSKLGIRGDVNDSFSANSVNGGIPMKNVMDEAVDISKYIDFGFYEKICLKDNYGISPSETEMWLVISNHTGRLICYHILNQTEKDISCSMVQLVLNLELSTDEVKEIFVKFDVEIHRRLKEYNCRYEGSKPSL